MNRNTESHFAYNPTNINIQRSKFERDSTHKTTFDAGQLIPIYLDEVLPGDTFKINQASVIRMTTPIYPTMDNAFCDFYYFFVPNRLLWDHWRELNGENRLTYWEQPTEYEVPQLQAPTGGWKPGTLADYFGIPTYVDNFSVSALPFRAYAMIWNEWFRDENLKQPCQVNTDDATTTGVNYNTQATDYVTRTQLGSAPLPVAKPHDYFTSALPAPQKHDSVLLPMQGTAPVYGTGLNVSYIMNSAGAANGKTYTLNTSNTASATTNASVRYTTDSQTAYSTGDTFHYMTKEEDPSGRSNQLYADLTQATGATINQLRQAFAIQRLYEKDARGGTRYTEILKAHFGVTSPDGRLQRPEYLGGYRLPINVQQVIQTSSTDETSPQGNAGAFSATSDSHQMFTQSFTEHGWILGLAAVRTNHTYQQGLDRMWSRKNRFDFYWSSLANIGEMGIKRKEIYLSNNNDYNNQIFGYQEAWADYRYKTSHVTGLFRSNVAEHDIGSLDSWHYADYYGNNSGFPYLSSRWIDETYVNINRTLAIQTQGPVEPEEGVTHQFIADFYFQADTTRPMPLYSIPGMIDHF